MYLLLLYSLSLCVFTTPWVIISVYEYKRDGISEIDLVNTFLSLIPIVNIPMGIAGWLMCAYGLCGILAKKINSLKKVK